MSFLHFRTVCLQSFLALLVMVGLLFATAAQAQQPQALRVRDIPSPRLKQQWITDLSGTVSAEAVEYINRVGDEVNQALGREMCVVVIDTTSGRQHRQFATELFNDWGVGKPGIPGAPGVWRNNGVMLFVAVKDRQAEIVLGDGIDGREQERVAQKIIDDIVVPNFAAGDGNSALYQGFRACATRIFLLADSNTPPTLPSTEGKSIQPRGPARKQRGPAAWLPFIIGGGVVGGIGLLIGGRYYLRYRPRRCEKCQLDRVLLCEEQDDQFLDSAQQLEEHLGSVDYDVWACLECEDVLSLRYGSFFTSYSTCPDCRYVTVHRIETTLVAANYSHGGRVHVVEECKNCTYAHRYVYQTPKLVKSKSSSGSSGFGGGGGGSGFSGGRSSGGGASGGW